jgi:hypothetical protein
LKQTAYKPSEVPDSLRVEGDTAYILAEIRKEDTSGKIWIGSRGDGLCIDNVWYKHDSSNPNSISENNIFAILKDSKNRMWIATFGGGLDLAVPQNGKYIFKHFLNQFYRYVEISFN